MFHWGCCSNYSRELILQHEIPMDKRTPLLDQVLANIYKSHMRSRESFIQSKAKSNNTCTNLFFETYHNLCYEKGDNIIIWGGGLEYFPTKRWSTYHKGQSRITIRRITFMASIIHCISQFSVNGHDCPNLKWDLLNQPKRRIMQSHDLSKFDYSSCTWRGAKVLALCWSP